MYQAYASMICKLYYGPNDRESNIVISNKICAYCGEREGGEVKVKKCYSYKAYVYGSNKCQKNHWRAGHKKDCKGHWVESFSLPMRESAKNGMWSTVCLDVV